MAVESIPEQNNLYVAPFEGAVLEVYNSHTKNLTKIIPLPNSETVLAPPPLSEQNNGGPFLTGGWSMSYDHINQILYVANYNANRLPDHRINHTFPFGLYDSVKSCLRRNVNVIVSYLF